MTGRTDAGGEWTSGAAGVTVPAVLALVALLLLVVWNPAEIDISEAVATSTLLMASATLVWVAARLATGSASAATLVGAVLVIGSLYYGYIGDLLPNESPRSWQACLLAVWLAVFAFLAWRAVRLSEARRSKAARVVFVASVALLTGSGAAVAREAFAGELRPAPKGVGVFSTSVDPVFRPPDTLPSIVYIVPDRYASNVVLQRYFDYDNGPFLEALRRRGFEVSEDSRANYLKTAQSLASALNLRYLADPAPTPVRKAGYRPLFRAIKESVVVEELQGLGYAYFNVGSWWQVTRTDHRADRDYFPELEPHCTPVGTLLLRGSVVRPILELAGKWPCPSSYNRHGHRRIALEQFSVLEHLPNPDRPTFTFAHVLLPHDPFVLNRRGAYTARSEVRRSGWRRQCVEQVRYLNGRLLAIIDSIDARGRRPTAILIQANEGPFLHDGRVEWTDAPGEVLLHKYGILTALRLPGTVRGTVPDDLGPVNLFRLVFDELFGAELGLLPEHNYVVPSENSLYTFRDVTGRLEAELEQAKDSLLRASGSRP